MKGLLNTCFGCSFAHLVIFGGGALYVIQCRVFRTIEAGHDHLRESEIFAPRNPIFLIFSQLVDAEVRTYAGDARISENCFQLDRLIFCESSKARIGVTDRGTKLNASKSGLSKLLDCAWEVFLYHFADRPGLT